MRIRISSAVIEAVVALGALAGSAQAKTCQNSTLSGDFAFTIEAHIYMPDQNLITTRYGVTIAHFDGAGHMTQTDYVNSLTPGTNPPGGADPNPVWRVGETGTYHVNANCTGTFEIDFPAPPGLSSGAVIKLMFVVAGDGSQIHTVVSSLTVPGATTPTPAVIRSDAWKVSSSDN